MIQSSAARNPFLRCWVDYASGLAHSVPDASAPLLVAATSPGARSGDYYGPRHNPFGFHDLGLRGPPAKVRPWGFAADAAKAAVLWEFSERACGISFSPEAN
mmetsp:Transcript_34168/g.111707  ORF Transcript_34168/g.111707 Transcript_34168/m.111707 type:complete len:102 (-) Transcript_34168:161-466(-)